MMRRMSQTAPLRLLHTSDWHLGQELHGLSREAEHRAFLAWLLDALTEQDVDALLVTGDVFDTQNPPITAQAMLYEFLAKAKRARPDLDVVIIGGNHDSAARLEAPNAILKPLDVHVVGHLPKEPAKLLVPLTDRDGRTRALCAAIPFLRLADLPVPVPGEEVEDALVWGVRAVHERIFTAALARCEAEALPLVATGHCYMVGSALSEMSERRILGGNQHALPADLFPDACAYVALGHLHKPQAVGGRDTVRYAGSPFPLSVTEKDYKHQAVLVEVGAETTVTPLLVPRTVDYLRVPRTGAAAPEDVLAELAALDLPADPGRDLRPYLEVVVRLERPSPSLRHDVEQALEGKPVRLCRLAVEYVASETAAPVETPDLAGLHPEEVFERAWARFYPEEPPGEAHRHAFRELLEGLHDEAGAQSEAVA